jgi:NodT family efflux transporter outer membrane factor (OMF) lipoprotein
VGVFGDRMAEQKYRYAVAASCAALLLSGCAVGPDFVEPAAPDVDRYTREHLASHTSGADVLHGQSQHFVVGQEIPAEWWQAFRSPAINAMVRQALENNPNLQSTIASLRSAKELIAAQQGRYFPLITGNFTPQRQLVASEISTPLATAPTGADLLNLYTAQVAVSYTFDVWGLNRRTVESLQALADSQSFQVEAAYLTLISNVMLAAIQEAGLRAQIDATERLIQINTKMLGVLRNQLNTGYENRIDVAAQEAQLAQIAATLPPLRKALAQQRDLLTALIGRFPSQEPKETFRLAELKLPANLPVSLPAALIEQRPDVRLAEEQLHSASAMVGVAMANMLPSLTVNAGAGYTSTSLASLMTGPNLFWTVAGSMTQPLFDGLTLLHTERAAQATYQAAAWSYRGTVVGALQNVADSLRAIQNDADALKAANEFEKAAKISLTLSQQQMQTGQANVLFLLNAQITYEQATIQVVQAQTARLSDTVALFAALGGGWKNRLTPPAPELIYEAPTGQVRPVAPNAQLVPVAAPQPPVLSSRAEASTSDVTNAQPEKQTTAQPKKQAAAKATAPLQLTAAAYIAQSPDTTNGASETERAPVAAASEGSK